MTKSIRRMTTAGVLTALVTIATFMLRVPVPATSGYIHMGDGIVLFSALCMGSSAAWIGGIGSALSDILGGYFAYVLPTFVIKAVMAWIVVLLQRKASGSMPRTILFLALASLWMVAGYFVVEAFMFGFAAALSAVIPNVLQGLAGTFLACLLNKLDIQRFLHRS